MTDEPLTYDELFDTYLREKSQEELQQLAPDFFERLAAYMSNKQAAVRTSATDTFSLQKKEKALHQMRNIRKVIQDLYDRRERKIVQMALVKARTDSPALDFSAFSPEEQLLFDSLAEVLGKARTEKLTALLDVPVGPEQERAVVFLEDMPAFMDKQLQRHGPFKAEETARLPATLAAMLIEKGKAKQA